MRKQFLGVFLLGLMICLAGGSAQAQDSGRITLFGGYSFMDNNWGNGCVAACAGGAATQLHGYAFSATYNFTNHFGIEANLAGHNGSPVIISEPVTSTSNGEVISQGQDIYT